MEQFIEEKNRIFLNNETGDMVAEITFPSIDDNTVDINHTFVDESLRGQGIAGKLVLAAVDKLRNEKKKIVATCPYVVTWFQRNEEYKDLLK